MISSGAALSGERMKASVWIVPTIMATGVLIGALTLWLNFYRGRPKLHVKASIKDGRQGFKRIHVHVINTGNIAVPITEIFLASRNGEQSKVPFRKDALEGNWAPQSLAPGAETRLRTLPRAFDQPFMCDVYGVVIRVGDRDLIIKSRSLTEHASKLRNALGRESAE